MRSNHQRSSTQYFKINVELAGQVFTCNLISRPNEQLV